MADDVLEESLEEGGLPDSFVGGQRFGVYGRCLVGERREDEVVHSLWDVGAVDGRRQAGDPMEGKEKEDVGEDE